MRPRRTVGRGSDSATPTGPGYRCLARRRPSPPRPTTPDREDTTNSKRDAGRVQERLTKVQAEYKRVLATQRELEEQVFFLHGVADEAETRKLVAETPLADREWRAARTDLERHRVLLEEARSRLQELEDRRNALLDRLLDS